METSNAFRKNRFELNYSSTRIFPEDVPSLPHILSNCTKIEIHFRGKIRFMYLSLFSLTGEDGKCLVNEVLCVLIKAIGALVYPIRKSFRNFNYVFVIIIIIIIIISISTTNTIIIIMMIIIIIIIITIIIIIMSFIIMSTIHCYYQERSLLNIPVIIQYLVLSLLS